MRLLLVAFYFPPAGGGGVQRALKFCRYLPEFGVDVQVLAPHDPKWFVHDEPLLGEIPAGVRVHRTRFPGPRAALRADALLGTSGLRRLLVEARFAYGRALFPDKAVPWLSTAAPTGVRIVRRERIDAVMTTSPPNSVHLIGALVAAATGRPWIADFRDPWIGFLQRRAGTAPVRAKRALERRLARTVVRRASALTAVTDHIAEELAVLHPSAAAKTRVIENGSDFGDFAPLAYRPGERFVIVHAGAFFGGRSPRPFLAGLRLLLERRPDLRGRILARFVGELRPADRTWARALGIEGAWEETGFVPYREAIAAQRAADAVLLLVEDAEGRGEKVPCGKLWEYLAARRPILASVPVEGVAARTVRSLGAGEVVGSEDSAGIASVLEAMVDRWQDGGLADLDPPADLRERVSRRTKARELAALLREVAP
jgi:glycosyltransferase involved in cell wall biosynthesis